MSLSIPPKTMRIEAFDTLFFRDGKPFDRGDTATGSVTFPPAPSVFHGALRTAYFAQQPAAFQADQARNGQIDRMTDSLRLTSVCLHDGHTALFPVPHDLVIEKKHRKDAYVSPHRLSLAARPAVSSLPSGLHTFRANSEETMVGAGAYRIKQADLLDYLNGEALDYARLTALSNFYSTEQKVGIGRDPRSGSVREGQLYFVNFIRPVNSARTTLRFELGYQARWEKPLEDKGYLRLGGEGKSAHYQHTDAASTMPPIMITGKTLKLYLATPAYFREGWLPQWIDRQTLEGNYELADGTNIRVRLCAAATDRPLHVGGFDQRRNRPKPMRRLVPAGSVYYLTCDSVEEAQMLTDALHGNCLSDPELSPDAKTSPSDYYRQRGFGIVYCGNSYANE